MTIELTSADLDALDSVFKRAEDDWLTYFASGHGPSDFPTASEWREHVRTVNTGLNRVRRIIKRASRPPARPLNLNSVKKGLTQ